MRTRADHRHRSERSVQRLRVGEKIVACNESAVSCGNTLIQITAQFSRECLLAVSRKLYNPRPIQQSDPDTLQPSPACSQHHERQRQLITANTTKIK